MDKMDTEANSQEGKTENLEGCELERCMLMKVEKIMVLDWG